MREFEVGADWYSKTYAELKGFSEGSIGKAPNFIDATLYLSTEFTPVNLDEFAAFKAFVSHRMGFILYLNGEEFFRRYLPDSDVKYTTFATEESTVTNNIELILPSVYLKKGKNTLSIEVHRKAKTEDTKQLIFSLYASKISELGDGCLIISTNTYSKLNSTEGLVSGGNTAENALDYDPSTEWWTTSGVSDVTKAWVSILLKANTYGWFNQIGWRSIDAPNSAGSASQPYKMTFYGLYKGVWEILDTISNINVVSESQRFVYHHIENIKLYEGFNFSIDAVKVLSADMRIGDVFVGACQKFYCDADGGFPATSSGVRISAQCGAGRVGTMFRVCGIGKNPVWGEPDESRCFGAPPSNLKYPKELYFLVTYAELQEKMIPSVVYLGKLSYEIHPQLPLGMKFNNETGEISDSPIVRVNTTVYTVRATDPITLIGIETVFTMEITAVFCQSIGLYPSTMGGDVAKIDCDTGFTGNKQRKCEDGKTPRWSQEESLCIDKRKISTGNVILISVLSICSVIAVAAIILCCYGKYRASKRKGGRLPSNNKTKAREEVNLRSMKSKRGQKSIRI